MTRFCRAAALAFVACVFAVTPARASTDTHETGRDVRIEIASDGSALVDETTHVRLFASGWKGLDVSDVEADAAPEPDASITSLDGTRIAALLVATPPNALHVDPLDPKALKKGDYAVHFRYRTQLVESHEVARDGALWTVSWTSPPTTEGLDGARVVFDLPAAPTEPTAARDASLEPEAAGFLSTLRRNPERDELELVRLHVARGESIVWSARIDPKALAAVHDPLLRPPPPQRAKPIENPFARFGGAWRVVIAAFLGALFLVAAVAGARQSRAAKSSRKSLILLHPLFAAVVAAMLYATGVWLQFVGSSRVAAAVLALAFLAALTRLAIKKPSPRGPGKWDAVSEEILFGKTAPPAWLDARTLHGRIAFVALLGIAAALTAALQPVDDHAWLTVTPMVVPWLALWFSSSLDGEPNAKAAARHLRALFRALGRSGARVIPWGRTPVGRTELDDLRLLIVPDAALPGLIGIEVAVGFFGCAGGFTPRVELFVRTRDASAAAAKMGSLSRVARGVTGRRPEERVYILEPSDTSRAGLLGLVEASMRELVDRRLIHEEMSWSGGERRKAIAQNREAHAA